jgi:glucokinase
MYTVAHPFLQPNPPMDKLLLSLDYGGTKLSAALCSPSARPETGWLVFRRAYSPPEADAAYDQCAMLALAGEMLADHGQPAAVGVSFGGPVDFERGLVRLSHHVPGWENAPLAQQLAEIFQAPVRVDNDANVAALGEARYGAGQRYTSLMYLTVSTGVGGGLILDGQPWRGHGGMAGEIGHVTIDPEGPECLCGKRGCVERYASGPYMAEDARLLIQAEPERGLALLELAGGRMKSITAEILSQAAKQGDPLARQVLERGAWALGTGIGNAANLLNPQAFILGGGVTKAGDFWWQAVRKYARNTALPEVEFDILPAALGDDAPLWGAVALANEALEEE